LHYKKLNENKDFEKTGLGKDGFFCFLFFAIRLQRKEVDFCRFAKIFCQPADIQK